MRAASTSPRLRFHIEAQPIHEALAKFRHLTELTVIVPPTVDATVTCLRVRGYYTPRGALRQLLAATRLRAKRLDSKTIVIWQPRTRVNTSASGGDAIGSLYAPRASNDETATPNSCKLAPRSRLPDVAASVAQEVAMLAESDPGMVQNNTVGRLIAAELLQQETRIADGMRDLKATEERERSLLTENGELKQQLSASRQAFSDEHKLRMPRSLFVGVGSSLLPVGADQFASGRHSLGITLIVLGVLCVAGCNWLAIHVGTAASGEDDC